MQETMTSNVINQLVGVVVKLNTIAKIYKYRGLRERHHLILMAMEVHGTLGHDMDCFIKECACPFHVDDHEIIYPCHFAFNFISNVLVLLFNML
jgi:hypothetical protein